MTQQPEASPAPLGDRAKDLASEAGRNIAEKVNEQADKGMKSLGKKLDEAADYVRDRGADAADRAHIDARHVDNIADRIHGAASYLQDRDPRSALSDLDQSIQKHPYRALLVGAAVGYVVGRFFRRR
jgi:ElaB/YqjD/DUF883 family membrane-anchored ribosome-binding protein